MATNPLSACDSAHGPVTANGRLAGAEALDHHVVAGVRAEQTGCGLLRQERRGSQATLGVDAEILGVVGAVLVLAEDVATERRQDRLQVVRVTLGADLQGDALVGRIVGVLRLEVGRDLDHLLERGRRLGDEVGVADERDVLDRVRQPVRLALVRERVDRDLLEVGGDAADVERLDDAVRDELTEPVVGTDDDVGAVRRRGRRG